MSYAVKAAATVAAALGGFALLFTFERPPVDSVQTGYRGLGIEQVYNPRSTPVTLAANQVPEVIARVPAVGPKAGQVYQNVQVLGDVTVTQFARTMAALTTWVAPQQGCNYCHNPNNMASDEIYTKVVARRMLQMTARINAEWKSHVQETGVTCYTCHRGNPVPNYSWARNDTPPRAGGLSVGTAGQNLASASVDLTSLPYDPFTPYLSSDAYIRVQTPAPRVTPVKPGIKDAEWTYALMIHMSTSLGVNCTYCHNTRAWYSWEESPPTRTNAWHGIRMVRDINNNYIDPLQPNWAANPYGPPTGPNQPRVGIHGDPLKVNCGTCHQGAYKPLLGVSMLRDYPELNAVTKLDAPPPIRE
ncbi:photosynthetic reaction center cytochrome PufC [Paracraurococcus lichenis]|uniref:Photosynthetic reaction center cytochrome c subunit n=1 Tax=Paracraurococcus lichenis TaxID=3064888 RepID=A0ABT9DUB0_9PROT|nr:photosynthetic reaction center cytochrome PufC [Paracraurococcus sp. LOR1-02]MDO9707486.1 photosynthetic reaction center cytochrome PufC [Paracraurococcus sp. LOR1-02]